MNNDNKTKKKKTTQKTRSSQINTNKKNNKKKSEKNKINNKKILTTENILLVLFILLLFLVIFLGIKVYQKNKSENKKIKANIVIPITKKEQSAVLNVDLNELAKQEEYVFKITNYRNEELIKENISYKITIHNDTDTILELRRNNINNNLITNQRETTIDSLKLYNQEKEDIYYHLRIIKKGNIKEKDVVVINVNS